MKYRKMIILTLTLLLLTSLCCTSALAAGGDVAGAVEQTWTEAAKQIKSVVEKVVFPALDMILAIAFFVKLGGAYFDYRQRGQFEWTGPAILFAGLSCQRQRIRHNGCFAGECCRPRKSPFTPHKDRLA